MIKVRGWQVSPAELEAVLIRHPDVLEAAVIGTNLQNSTDEAPRAYIIKKSDSKLDEAKVKSHMLIHLAKYKALDGGIVFTNSIPRTPAGKVSKKVLRERASKESKDNLIKDLILMAISMFGHSRPTISDIPDSTDTSESGQASSEQPSSLGYIEANDHQVKAPTTTSSVYSDANADAISEAALEPNNRGNIDGNGLISDSIPGGSDDLHRKPFRPAEGVRNRGYICDVSVDPQKEPQTLQN